MKASRFFSIFVGMSVIPLILAYLVLKMGWFTPGATNKGEFVQHELQLTLEHSSPTWSLVYQPNDQQCNQVCEEQIYALNQTYLALGKLQKDVRAYVLNPPSPIKSEYVLDSLTLESQGLSPDYIYLVDPFGKVILQYATSHNRNESVQMSKDMLADVKKLLKYARMG